MWLDLAALIAGLALLVFGGEALVRGASALALLARVPAAVVGLTIVAAGTSAPELVVSLQAALQGNPGIAVGNVVGSNIFNAAAILGLAALLRPLCIRGNTVRLEWPVMMLAAVQFHLLARDGTLDRLEGSFLVLAMAAFTAYTVWVGRGSVAAVEQREFEEQLGPLQPVPGRRSTGAAWARQAATVLVGIALLGGGSTLLVGGAVGLAEALGVPEVIVGLTVVAAGTSLPELVTSVVAALRGQDDIAVANVVGSNVFNVLGIAGCTALVHPVPVPAVIIEEQDWWMIGVSLLLFPLMRSGMRIGRLEGALLLAVFAAFLARLVLTS